jgi:hypothetical protein
MGFKGLKEKNYLVNEASTNFWSTSLSRINLLAWMVVLYIKYIC